MTTLLLALGGAVALLLTVGLLVLSRIKVAGPNEAFIITGRKGKAVTDQHTGAVSTDLGRYLYGEKAWNDLKDGKGTLPQIALAKALSVFIKTVPEGANTQIWLPIRNTPPCLNKRGYNSRLNWQPQDRQRRLNRCGETA